MNTSWFTLEGSLAAGRSREFYLLWIFATLAYGVGDIVSTIALIDYDPFVREGNVFVQLLYAEWGLTGFVAGKLTVFLISFAISLYALKAWQDRLLYFFPPVVLTVMGTAITVYNIYLLNGG